MRTILVLSGGSETDEAVYETALAAGPAAHLECFHVRLSAAEALLFTPHADFAQGAALRDAMEQLQSDAEARSAAAARRFYRFCAAHEIAISAAPAPGTGISASWLEERGEAAKRILLRARRNECTVIGRRSRANGLPRDLSELLVVGSGRPVLIAPPHPPERAFETVLVCWKETAEASRALMAALPLLAAGKRVIVATVEETAESPGDDLGIVRQLAWHGISAEPMRIPAEGRPVHEELECAATRYGADLLVMGAYGHSRARQLVFGGCTQHFLDGAELPVLLMH